jgi:hypothetical protein
MSLLVSLQYPGDSALQRGERLREAAGKWQALSQEEKTALQVNKIIPLHWH